MSGASAAGRQAAEEPRGHPAPVFALDLPGARVAFSTRLGGVSEGPYESLNLGILTDDDQGLVAHNRRLLAESLGLDVDAIAIGVQVHGAEVLEWGAGAPAPAPAERDAELPHVDGHATERADLALLVLGADCLPVALAARARTGAPGRVAMIHCGWRGLAGGIVERAVAGFSEAPSAAIGPGIGGCCYEVGPEVLEAFAGLDGVVAAGEARQGHGMLHLRAVARHKLAAAGVADIQEVDFCTSCRTDLFFSHRRDQGVSGRQGGVVWRTR